MALHYLIPAEENSAKNYHLLPQLFWPPAEFYWDRNVFVRMIEESDWKASNMPLMQWFSELTICVPIPFREDVGRGIFENWVATVARNLEASQICDGMRQEWEQQIMNEVLAYHTYSSFIALGLILQHPFMIPTERLINKTVSEAPRQINNSFLKYALWYLNKATADALARLEKFSKEETIEAVFCEAFILLISLGQRQILVLYQGRTEAQGHVHLLESLVKDVIELFSMKPWADQIPLSPFFDRLEQVPSSQDDYLHRSTELQTIDPKTFKFDNISRLVRRFYQALRHLRGGLNDLQELARCAAVSANAIQARDDESEIV